MDTCPYRTMTSLRTSIKGPFCPNTHIIICSVEQRKNDEAGENLLEKQYNLDDFFFSGPSLYSSKLLRQRRYQAFPECFDISLSMFDPFVVCKACSVVVCHGATIIATDQMSSFHMECQVMVP